MKNKKITLYQLFTFLFILFSLSTNLTYAQNSSIITAIPPRLELEIKPGQTIKTQLKVRNETSTTQIYSVNVTDFIVSDDIGTPIPVTEKIAGRFASSSWIISPKTVPVDPKTTRYVNLTITAPKNAAPGGHYALLTYQPNGDLKPEELKKTGALIGQKTGTLIYFIVPGKINLSALISQFRTDKFNEYGPINFDIAVKNSSDIHLSPKGKITIKDFLGQTVSTVPVEMPNVFPETVRKITAQWKQKWGYGRYEATLDLVYGTSNTIISSTILFWLFPIRLVTYILVLIISLLSAIILVRNKQLRHQKDLEKEVIELKKELESK